MQYHTLLQPSHEPRESSYLTTIVLLAGIKVYVVLARDVFPSGSAAGAFYRKLKLGVVEHIAGIGFGGCSGAERWVWVGRGMWGGWGGGGWLWVLCSVEVFFMGR